MDKSIPIRLSSLWVRTIPVFVAVAVIIDVDIIVFSFCFSRVHFRGLFYDLLVFCEGHSQ